jgi:hypothetical protein
LAKELMEFQTGISILHLSIALLSAPLFIVLASIVR